MLASLIGPARFHFVDEAVLQTQIAQHLAQGMLAAPAGPGGEQAGPGKPGAAGPETQNGQGPEGAGVEPAGQAANAVAAAPNPAIG
jgi:hypothetical protein